MTATTKVQLAPAVSVTGGNTWLGVGSSLYGETTTTNTALGYGAQGIYTLNTTDTLGYTATTAIGTAAEATGNYGTAVGFIARAEAEAVALGGNSVVFPDSVLVVGSANDAICESTQGVVVGGTVASSIGTGSAFSTSIQATIGNGCGSSVGINCIYANGGVVGPNAVAIGWHAVASTQAVAISGQAGPNSVFIGGEGRGNSSSTYCTTISMNPNGTPVNADTIIDGVLNNATSGYNTVIGAWCYGDYNTVACGSSDPGQGVQGPLSGQSATGVTLLGSQNSIVNCADYGIYIGPSGSGSGQSVIGTNLFYAWNLQFMNSHTGSTSTSLSGLTNFPSSTAGSVLWFQMYAPDGSTVYIPGLANH